MEWGLGAVVVFIVLYLLRNLKRNSDPLNRKCASELCHLYTAESSSDKVLAVADEDVFSVFMSNARYKNQALHVTSMVPALLIRAGYPREQAMSVVPQLKMISLMIPS
ncbi:hypothetical protein [Magnetovibrio blakemorei]|uniref:hypothetical protein n=1 Tax=Magnetovibrio blakemorei TaxID=28181 RepID=UPI001112E77F|nr:hypothetical protein [Magnetovibrio blakemorei]